MRHPVAMKRCNLDGRFSRCGLWIVISLSLDQWADVAQIATFFVAAAAIAGLYFAGKEYKRQVGDSRVELLTGMTRYLNEVAKVFVEYPEMRKYFHDGDRPNRKDRPRAEAVAVVLANAMDHVLTHLDVAGEAESNAWETYFEDLYARSSVFKEYLDEHEEWYGAELRARIATGGTTKEGRPVEAGAD